MDWIRSPIQVSFCNNWVSASLMFLSRCFRVTFMMTVSRALWGECCSFGWCDERILSYPLRSPLMRSLATRVYTSISKEVNTILTSCCAVAVTSVDCVICPMLSQYRVAPDVVYLLTGDLECVPRHYHCKIIVGSLKMMTQCNYTSMINVRAARLALWALSGRSGLASKNCTFRALMLTIMWLVCECRHWLCNAGWSILATFCIFELIDPHSAYEWCTRTFVQRCS